MGYLDNQIGYPNDIFGVMQLSKDNYAIIPPNGVVCNIIPGFTDCNMTILSTPKLELALLTTSEPYSMKVVT